MQSLIFTEWHFCGCIYKSQTLEFLRPVFIGDTLCAWFEIMGIDQENIR